MSKLTEKQMSSLQSIVDGLNTEKYVAFGVQELFDGIYLVPEIPRHLNDPGEFMGTTYIEAKRNIMEFVLFLNN